ncbi:DMT family transporter [Pseudonocardia phyllosphaerae]|uniref:DMT family transporter n=1 Tax=Pseudonocardia phyllosphaerae TaxID=3390502 RepID=UPI003978BD9B
MTRAASALGFGTAFVLVWSSGYIAGSLGAREADPVTLGFWRFAIATVVLGVAVAVRGPRWPARPRQWLDLLAIGALLQNVQFTGAFAAIGLGMSAGLAALISDASPVVVAVASVVLFGERLRPLQVAGVVLGVAGVCVVVGEGLDLRFGPAALVAAVVGLAGAAGGTLYQKAVQDRTDMLTATFVQLVGATATMAPVAALHGGFTMPLTPTTVAVVLWLAGIGSILAFVLLFALLRSRSGAEATSLLFLVPPTTAVLGALLLAEPLTAATLLGFGVAAAGVRLVVRRPARRRAGGRRPAPLRRRTG